MDTKARITDELRIRTLKLEATSRKTIDPGMEGLQITPTKAEVLGIERN